jgi:uncharacterized protein (DUF2141 family)
MRKFILAAALIAGPAFADTLTVEVVEARDDKGQAVVALWKASDGFGSFDLKQATTILKAPIKGGTATVTFEGLAPGTYAVSAFHDADGTGSLKTNFIGMPKEGVGVSNNAGGMPRFMKSTLTVRGVTKTRVRLRYL